MSASSKVFSFVLISFTIYLLVSFLSVFFNVSLRAFDNVNILSDLFPESGIHTAELPKSDTAAVIVVEKKEHYDFNLYQQPKTITDFNADQLHPSLEKLMRKLADLKTGKKKRKIRIAYFGDSMIEGDLLTQTLRKLLQTEFGGSGVGFVPVDCVSAGFRQTASSSASGWDAYDFKRSSSFIPPSGHVFFGNTGQVNIVNRDLRHAEVLEKSLLCGASDQEIQVNYNHTPVTIHPTEPFNRIVLSKDNKTAINLSVSSSKLPVFGMSFESESGIIVDNFSFRGISGIELAKVKDELLASISKNNAYDLIVFQYGVNLLFRPNDMNFNYYAKAFKPVISKFKRAFPEAEILIVSTADRAFRYKGEYHSAVGIDSVVKIQAKLAYESETSFYNQFQSMGGHDAIVDWANRSPSLANKDYIHPNHRGAEVLAGFLFEAIMKEYQHYIMKQPSKNPHH